MELLEALTKLGPVAGTVLTVIIFVRFASVYMKNEHCHREKLARECHTAQDKATEATLRAAEAINRIESVMTEVNTTLIRMNGRPKH